MYHVPFQRNEHKTYVSVYCNKKGHKNFAKVSGHWVILLEKKLHFNCNDSKHRLSDVKAQKHIWSTNGNTSLL